MKLKLKIGDIGVYIFVLLLIAGSFAGLAQMGRRSGEPQVIIEIDGKVIGTYTINGSPQSLEIPVDAGQGRYNIVTVNEGIVDMREANCPDQICVRWGRIRYPGQAIVCLPHRVVVRIIGGERGEPPVDDISG